MLRGHSRQRALGKITGHARIPGLGFVELPKALLGLR